MVRDRGRGLSALRIAAIVGVIAVVVGAAFIVSSYLPRAGSTSTASVTTSASTTPTITTSTTSTSTFPVTTTSTSSTATFTTTTTTTAVASLCSGGPCAPLISGWLHTEPNDTNIYESNGTAVRLLGLNAIGLEFGTGTSTPDSCGEAYSYGALNFSISEFDNVASWGFNSVRIPLTWENLEPTAPTLAANGTWIHHWNTQYLDELDYVIAQFGQRHIAVILDFSQVDLSGAFQQAPEQEQGGECEGWGVPLWMYPSITSPTTEQELAMAVCNFFSNVSAVGNSTPSPIQGMEAAEQLLASRYVNNPTVVGLDMFNEPWFSSSTPCGAGSTPDSLLTSFYANMSKVVSAANPHLLIIFEDALPKLTPNVPILTSPPPVPNAVYSLHVYTSDWSTAQPLLQSHLTNAEKMGVPLWMGEFDAFEAGSSGVNAVVDPNWQVDTQTMLAFCKDNGISWAFFSYYSLSASSHAKVDPTLILSALRGGF